MRVDADDMGVYALLALFVGALAAFVTHLYWIIHLLMTSAAIPGGKVLLAVIGVLFPPFGCVHGVYLWFNAW